MGHSMSDRSFVQPIADPLILAAAAKDVERAIAATGIDSHRVLELADVDPAGLLIHPSAWDSSITVGCSTSLHVKPATTFSVRASGSGSRRSISVRLVHSLSTLRPFAMAYRHLQAIIAGFRRIPT
jgi:hypothetical protein